MNNWNKRVRSYLKETTRKKILSSGPEALKEMAEQFMRLAGGKEQAIELIRKYAAEARAAIPQGYDLHKTLQQKFWKEH